MRKGGSYKDGKPVVQPKPDPEIDVSAKRRADNLARARAAEAQPKKEG